MRLQGDEGYYSREVEYEGDTFKIREMAEAERTETDAIAERLLALQREVNGLFRKEETESGLTDIDYAHMNKANLESRELRRQHTDLVVAAGVVGWSDKRDCTPDLVVKLPPKLKTYLAREIAKDSTLGFTEVDFLPVSRTP